MERLRFSIHLLPRFSDETDRMFHGVVDFGKLFLHTGHAPQADMHDWIVWFAHHHLSLTGKALATAKPELMRTPALSGWGLSADEGFLTGVLGRMADVEAQALHWSSDEGVGLRHYTDPQGRTVTPDAPLNLLPRTLFKPEGVRRWNASTRWDNDATDLPNDIDWANAAIAMGGVAQARLTDPNHPFFALCTLLGFMDLPNGQAFPKRTNMTGWTALFEGSHAWASSAATKGTNTTLAWLFREGILRPAHVFFEDAFAPGQLWDEANAATRSHPARAFGARLVDVAKRHASTITAARHNLLESHDSNPSYPTTHTTSHAKLAWNALVQDVTAAGHTLGLF